MRGEEERSRRPRRERPVFSRWASNTKGCTSSTLPWPLSLPDSLPHLPWAALPPLPPPGFGLSPRIRPRCPGVGGGATRDNTGTALRTGLRGGARQRDTARTKHGEVMAAGSGAGNMLPPWNELQSRLAIPTPAKNGALYGNTTRRNSFSLDLRESLRNCRSEGQRSRARVGHRLTCDGRGYLQQFPGERMVIESINKGGDNPELEPRAGLWGSVAWLPNAARFQFQPLVPCLF